MSNLHKIGIGLFLILSLALMPMVAAAEDLNQGEGTSLTDAAGLPANLGQVVCTADVNSDGTVAGGLHAAKAKSLHISTGQYQVGFNKPCLDIRAANGYARWLQVDTLSTGTISGGVSCTTADRYEVPSAVWVNCTDSSGALVDTSFFLFIAH